MAASGGRQGRTTALVAACAAAGTAVAVYAGWRVYVHATKLRQRNLLVQQYRLQLIASSEQLKELKRELIAQLDEGLRQEIPANGRQMLMLPSFVKQLPTGYETGDVYAIDMGGTNFRVMYVPLTKERSGVGEIDSIQVAIPKEVYTGTGIGLFDFLAKNVAAFIDRHGGSSSMKRGEDPVVGFCFSFPMQQTALDQGILLDWTKGFTCDGVIGNNPVQLLSEAMKRAGRPVRVAALLNDAVALIAAHRYLVPSTSIGVIVGTGTNACYVEKTSRLTKWPESATMDEGAQTAVNIEWGSFDSEHLPRCPEDWDVDKATLHTGKYMFEKLLSGLFLGDIARRVLLRLAADTQLLGDFGTDTEAARVFANLADPDSFGTAHLAQIVEDDTRMLSGVASVLSQAIGASQRLAPFSTRQVVREICELVALRSAQLVAIALDAILTHAGWVGARDGPTTIAFDGSVYSKFPSYRRMLQGWLIQFRGQQEAEMIQLQLSHDGSCLGAAVLAAAAVEGTPVPAATTLPAEKTAPESSVQTAAAIPITPVTPQPSTTDVSAAVQAAMETPMVARKSHTASTSLSLLSGSKGDASKPPAAVESIKASKSDATVQQTVAAVPAIVQKQEVDVNQAGIQSTPPEGQQDETAGQAPVGSQAEPAPISINQPSVGSTVDSLSTHEDLGITHLVNAASNGNDEALSKAVDPPHIAMMRGGSTPHAGEETSATPATPPASTHLDVEQLPPQREEEVALPATAAVVEAESVAVPTKVQQELVEPEPRAAEPATVSPSQEPPVDTAGTGQALIEEAQASDTMTVTSPAEPAATAAIEDTSNTATVPDTDNANLQQSRDVQGGKDDGSMKGLHVPPVSTSPVAPSIPETLPDVQLPATDDEIHKSDEHEEDEGESPATTPSASGGDGGVVSPSAASNGSAKKKRKKRRSKGSHK